MCTASCCHDCCRQHDEERNVGNQQTRASKSVQQQVKHSSTQEGSATYFATPATSHISLYVDRLQRRRAQQTAPKHSEEVGANPAGLRALWPSVPLRGGCGRLG